MLRDVILKALQRKDYPCFFHCLVERSKDLFERSMKLGCNAEAVISRQEAGYIHLALKNTFKFIETWQYAFYTDSTNF